MMNIRNFHLKSNLIAFNSQDLSLNLSKQIAKKQKFKIEKSIFKQSEPVQIGVSNLKQASRFCQECDFTKSKPQPPMAMFDFNPPMFQENKRTIKNRSFTLSPQKMSQKVTLPYQLYPSNPNRNQNHKRRFSDSNVIKKFNKRSNTHSKTRPDVQSQSLLNPQALRRYNNADLQVPSQKPKQKMYSFDKTMTKIKVFEIDNFFGWSQDQKIIHSGKNGSPFISTLPNKIKNFRTTKSTSLRQRKPESLSIEKDQEKEKVIPNESQTNSQTNQKYQDFSRSVHTAASGTARRIDIDKLCYSPLSTGFFPQSSIWNRQEQFVRNTQVKPRSYKLIQKSTPSSKNSKQKDNYCRPWSPSKPQQMIQQLDQEEVFPQIKQH